jgi:hypothetical protein
VVDCDLFEGKFVVLGNIFLIRVIYLDAIYCLIHVFHGLWRFIHLQESKYYASVFYSIFKFSKTKLTYLKNPTTKTSDLCLTRHDFSVHLKRQPIESKMGLEESLGEDPNYVKTNHSKNMKETSF